MADDLTQLGLVLLGQVLHAGIRVDPGLGQDLVGAGAPNAVDISEADLDSLLSRQVNTGNTSHLLQHLQLTLSLLMLGVFANYHDFALALNDFALLAHGLHGRSYFHCDNLLMNA